MSAQNMSPQVFAELVAQHRSVLLRHVARLTGYDWQLAEDIVQETLLRAWQRPSAMRADVAGLRPWLFTVSRNLVFDHARARQARPQETVDTELDRVPSEDCDIESMVERQAMRQALATLTPKYRSVLEEIYYRDRPLTDAAAALRIPVGTVKSRLYHAHRALRRAVDTADTSLPAAA